MYRLNKEKMSKIVFIHSMYAISSIGPCFPCNHVRYKYDNNQCLLFFFGFKFFKNIKTLHNISYEWNKCKDSSHTCRSREWVKCIRGMLVMKHNSSVRHPLTLYPLFRRSSYEFEHYQCCVLRRAGVGYSSKNMKNHKLSGPFKPYCA